MTESKVEDAPPALYGHCSTVFNEMLTGAKSHVNPQGDTIAIWEGGLVKLITGTLYLSIPYYSSITQALKRMGCISQMKRGGGSGDSQWELHYAPTLEMFLNAQPKKEKKQDKWSIAQEQLDSQNQRILALEDIVQSFVDAEIENQKRLNKEKGVTQ